MDSIENRYADLRAELLEKDQKLEHAHAIIKDLKRTAQNHHYDCQSVYTGVSMQAMYSESRVPKAEIEAFPDLPCALKSDPVNLKSDFNASI